MKKTAILSAAIAATAFTAPAYAQEENKPEVYIGANIGYHDLGAESFGLDIDDNGLIYGGYIGVDVPVGDTLIAGVEGNFNLGTSAIDSDYGVTAKLGIRVGNGGQFFVRGGYQEINLDIENFTNGLSTEDNVDDDTVDDYLVGIGAQFKVNDRISVRGIIDTVSFDTTRATFGLQYSF